MAENNYGGRRANAGPKFKGERVRLSTWISPEAHEILKRISKEEKLPMSDLLTILIEREV